MYLPTMRGWLALYGLERAGPPTDAYRVWEQLRDRLPDGLVPDYALVWQDLQRLAEKGFVELTGTEVGRTGHKKGLLAMTQAGRDKIGPLMKAIAEAGGLPFSSFDAPMLQFLLLCRVVECFDASVLPKMIERRIQILTSEVDLLRKEEKGQTNDPADSAWNRRHNDAYIAVYELELVALASLRSEFPITADRPDPPTEG